MSAFSFLFFYFDDNFLLKDVAYYMYCKSTYPDSMFTFLVDISPVFVALLGLGKSGDQTRETEHPLLS